MSATFSPCARWRGTLTGLLLALAACGAQDKTGEFYTQWDLAGGCAADQDKGRRHDADGRAHDVCDLADGRWVWVTYAAGWCQTSNQQARLLGQLRRAVAQRLEVVLVLTSGKEVFTVPSRADAQAWAARHGLPRGRVLYGTEDDSRTVPQHLLIGPDGRTWYRYVGLLRSEEITQLLDDFARGARLPDVRELAVK